MTNTSLMKLLFLITLISFTTSSKKCLDPNGNAVDWYAVFLFPENSSSDNTLSYGYFDSSSSSMKYHTYSESTFPPTRITKMALSSSSTNYFFWNDDLTCKDDSESRSASSSRAHAKGSLVYDSSSGAFLLHSLPRFPTCTKSGSILTELPDNAGVYGQHFLCISVSTSTANKLAELLNYINISNNHSVKSDKVNSSANKWVTKLISNTFDSSYPTNYDTTINSIGGTAFRFFGKNYKHQVIPYDTTLRSAYSDSFYVRTWTRPSYAPSLCDSHDLLNVLDVSYNNKWKFTKTKEHSKWAVAASKNIACFGDVNHVESQSKRGGNIVCFQNAGLANAMRKAIVNHDTCSNDSLGFLQFVE